MNQLQWAARKGRPFLFLTVISWLSALHLGCGQVPGKSAEKLAMRIATPESAAYLIEAAITDRKKVQLTPLKPASREEELEVLLFSSGSPTFSAIAMPADRIPRIERWLAEVPKPLGAGIRGDLLASLSGREGLKGLPLSVGVPVLIYRKDLWEQHGLQPPKTSTQLKECLWTLRSWDHETGGRLAISAPLTPVFWSLAWSAEGEYSEDLYLIGKVAALQLIEDSVSRENESKVPVGASFVAGVSAAVIATPQEAAEIERDLKAGNRGAWFGIAALPSAGPVRAMNFGWCLVGTKSGSASGSWWDLLNARRIPAETTARGSKLQEIVSAAQLCPHLVPDALNTLVAEAIADAVSGASTAEEALRRARARSQERPDA